jgi:hypothetical protein
MMQAAAMASTPPVRRGSQMKAAIEQAKIVNQASAVLKSVFQISLMFYGFHLALGAVFSKIIE